VKVVKQAGCKQLALDSAGTVARASMINQLPHGAATNAATSAITTAAAAHAAAAAAAAAPASSVLITPIVETYANALVSGRTTRAAVANASSSSRNDDASVVVAFNPWVPEAYSAADSAVVADAAIDEKTSAETKEKEANALQNDQVEEQDRANYETFRRQAHLFPYVLLRFWRPNSTNIVKTARAGAGSAAAAAAATADETVPAAAAAAGAGAPTTTTAALTSYSKEAATGRFYEVYLPRLPSGLHLDVFSDETPQAVARAQVSCKKHERGAIYLSSYYEYLFVFSSIPFHFLAFCFCCILILLTFKVLSHDSDNLNCLGVGDAPSSSKQHHHYYGSPTTTPTTAAAAAAAAAACAVDHGREFHARYAQRPSVARAECPDPRIRRDCGGESSFVERKN